MKNIKKEKGLTSGFTLVELIVVITILAILGTIGFLSFSGFSSSARDSVRTSDLTNLQQGLSLYQVKSGYYPIPDSSINITAGTGATGIPYTITQGVAGTNVLKSIAMSEAKDNLDNNYYSYSVDANKRHYTIGIFLENPVAYNLPLPLGEGWGEGLVDQVYAIDYTSRYLTIKGDSVGILTESGTKTPAEQLYTANTTVNLLTEPKILNLNISNTNTIIGSGQIIGIIQSNQNGNYTFNAPTSCPTGFIPVPGNTEFNQPGFCVMKYEAKALNGTAGPSANGVTYHTHDYTVSDTIVSNATDIPIATITQPQAITACSSLGAGYHLITNNEWMTIARNTEQQPNNWSGNAVGSGYIYSGHNDNSPAYAISASSNDSDGYNQTGNSSGNQKRTLTLSNGQIIWDLAGNVWEHVNKANTLDSTNIDSNSFSVESACSNGTWNWWSWSGNDGVAECLFQNSYSRSLYGPSGVYNANNGMGRIYATNTESINNIFIRGGAWGFTSSAGVFTLYLNWNAGSADSNVGFRCAK